MSAKNEAIVKRLIEEVFNQGQIDLLAELVAADHVGHDPLGNHYGREGLRIVVAEYRVAFPDLQVTVEDLVTARNKVVHRFSLRGTHVGPFLGISPTGRAVTAAGIAIDRFTDGKVAESWVSLDALSLLRQLGAVQTLGQGLERPAPCAPAQP